MFIKSESFADKIRELFQPLEIDIEEDGEFSRRFYVLAKDREKGQALLTTRFCSILKSWMRKDLEMEILSNILLINYAMDEEFEDAINLAFAISELRY